MNNSEKKNEDVNNEALKENMSEKKKVSKMKLLNKVASGISMGVLVIAVVCGLLRRFFGVELPPFITGWIIPVFTAAAVGYLTNLLAILLLFWPYEPVKWLGGLQGMIPRNRERIAKNLSEEIPKNLMPADQIISSIRQKVKDKLLDKEFPDCLHAWITTYFGDEKCRKELTQQIAAVLNTTGSTGVEFGLSPKNVRHFYHACGSGFVEEKVIRNKTLRAKIQDELRNQIPGLVKDIRENISNSIDNELLKKLYKRLPPADGMWKTIEENIQVKVSGKDTERLIERKLNDFKLRLDGYICSQELETDIAKLKQNPEIGDTLKDMSDFLSEKLLEFLEKEFVWKFIREKALLWASDLLDRLIVLCEEEILDWIDLKGHIYRSIKKLEPEKIREQINKVSEDELGMIQLLGFVLGGLAGFLLIFAR